MPCHNYRKFNCQSVLVSLSCCNKITEQVAYKKKEMHCSQFQKQKFKIRVPGWSGEGPLLSQRLLVSSHDGKGQEASFTSHKSHYKGHLQDLSTSQSPHLLISSPLGIRISTCKFSPYEDSDHCTVFPVSCPGTQLHPFMHCVWLLSQATVAELKNCDRDCMTYKAIYNVVFYRKSLPTMI